MATVQFSATPWVSSGNTSIGFSPAPRSSSGGSTTFSSSRIIPRIGGGGGSSSVASPSVNTAELHRNAKDLAQQQIDADLKKMEAAFGYRTKETDQKYGWERNIQGDKLASDERINTYNTDADKWKTQYTTDSQERVSKYGVDADKWKTQYTVDADKWKTQYSVDSQERMQLRGFGQEKDMANLNSTLRMREGEQQYGFQLGLQQDNNAAKERMQQSSFKQEKDMLDARVVADQESKRISALRAARAFRGNIPMGV